MPQRTCRDPGCTQPLVMSLAGCMGSAHIRDGWEHGTTWVVSSARHLTVRWAHPTDAVGPPTVGALAESPPWSAMLLSQHVCGHYPSIPDVTSRWLGTPRIRARTLWACSTWCSTAARHAGSTTSLSYMMHGGWVVLLTWRAWWLGTLVVPTSPTTLFTMLGGLPTHRASCG